MNTGDLVRASTRHRISHHVALAGAVAVCTAVVAGALYIGDSFSTALARRANRRLGAATFAVSAAGGPLTVALAGRMEAELATPVLPVILARGTLSRSVSGSLTDVTVWGIDGRFRRLAGEDWPVPAPGSGLLGRTVAGRLGVPDRDTVVLRLDRAHPVPGDLAFSLRGTGATALRFVARVLPQDPALGELAIEDRPEPPRNLFLPLADLQRELGQEGRATHLLIPDGGTAVDFAAVNRALDRCFRLTDASLALRQLSELPGSQLGSSRYLLPPAVDQAAGPGAIRILTAMADRLICRERSVSYALVTATDPPLPGCPDLGPGQIALDAWIARELGAGPGDPVDLEPFPLEPEGPGPRPGPARLRVRQLLPVPGPLDRWLTPEVPGLTDVTSCRDWEGALPLDPGRIHPADEQFWKLHGSTPRALLSLPVARALWKSRLGSLTALRFPGPSSPASTSGSLEGRIRPGSLGLTVRDLRAEARASVRDAPDFGGIYLGFSAFLVGGALAFLSLLLSVQLEGRRPELALFKAMGASRGQVGLLLFRETLPALGLGIALGLGAGTLHARVLLALLCAAWPAAAGGLPLELHISGRSLALAALGSLLLSGLVLAARIRSLCLLSFRELWTGSRAVTGSAVQPPGRAPRNAALLATLTLLAVLPALPPTWVPPAFVAAGFLLLTTGLLVLRAHLHARPVVIGEVPPALAVMGARALRRDPGPNLALAATLALASFPLVALETQTLHPVPGTGDFEARTGGFRWIGRAARPIRELPGARFSPGLAGGTVVPIRLSAGDDASCLNAARAQQPRLAGIPVPYLPAMTRFRVHGAGVQDPWRLLSYRNPGDHIIGLCDENTLLYGLGKSIGDQATCTAEDGTPVPVRIAGTLAPGVLQGLILVGEPDFLRLYPSHSGHDLVLVGGEDHALRGALEATYRDHGLILETTGEVMDRYFQVQNTYIRVLDLLGLMGLLLGIAGTSVTLLTTISGRRGELALLRALGFGRSRILLLLLAEKAVILATGIALGGAGGLIALIPLRTTSSAPASGATFFILGTVLWLAGMACTAAVGAWALRKDLIPELRRE